MCREVTLTNLSLTTGEQVLNLEDLNLLQEKDSETYRLVQVSLSKKSSTGKYLFSLWMRYVFLRALGYELKAYLETLEEDDVQIIETDTISTEEAKKQVVSLMKVFTQRNDGFIAFNPRASYGFKEDLESPELKDKIEKFRSEGGGFDLDLDFSLRDDEKQEVWNETNVKDMIQNVWAV